MKWFFLTDGSDLAGVTSSSEIKYMKVLRSALNLLAAWPTEALGLKPSTYAIIMKVYLLLQYFICWLLQLVYIKWNAGKLDIFTIGHNYITFLMNSVSMSRQCLPWTKKYQDVSRSFIQDIHLYYHKEKSDYAMKIHIQVHKLCHFFTMYLMSIMLVGIILFNLTPFVNNFMSGIFEAGNPNNKTYEYAVYYALPFDSERTNFVGFVSVTMYNIYISCCCSASFCVFDLHLSLMTFHMCGHLTILKHNLETFAMPKGKVDAECNALMFSDEESNVVFRRLKDCINHHRYILEFSENMSDAFGPMLFIYYTFHQISGCLLLLECSQMDTKSLVRYGILTVILFQQLMQLSIVFEFVGVMSENLVQAVYSVPWECMGTRDRKLVHVLLKKVQTSMHLKAMGLADVGVQAMASIIKTSLSYFAFLRSSNE